LLKLQDEQLSARLVELEFELDKQDASDGSTEEQ